MNSTIVRGGTALLDVYAILTKLGIKEGDVVGDLGCGGGGHFVIASAKMAGVRGTIYAVDVQKSVLEYIESRAKIDQIETIKTVWANLEKFGSVKIPDNECDIAILANVLFQNKDFSTILREAARIIKPGGRLAVIDWKKIAAPFGPPVELRVGEDVVKHYGQEAGLKFVDEFDAGQYHYVLIFMK